MSEKSGARRLTFDGSSESIELGLRQESEMERTVDETHADEPNLMSVDEKIKQATDAILRRVEELFALLASCTEMEPAGNNEASSLRRNRESSSSSSNRYDNHLVHKKATT